MGKKKVDPSLKGKKPINKVKQKKTLTRNPGHITNKLKRSEMYGKYLQEKRARKKEGRLKRIKETTALGEDKEATSSQQKQQPRTLDNAREVEETMVLPGDMEVEQDEAEDEFSPYFSGERQPKVLITTRPRPSKALFHFIADLQTLIPGLQFYPRKSFSVKEICRFATNRNFTHLMVLSEKDKKCNGLTISHLGSITTKKIATPINDTTDSEEDEEESDRQADNDLDDEDMGDEGEEEDEDEEEEEDDDDDEEEEDGDDDDDKKDFDKRDDEAVNDYDDDNDDDEDDDDIVLQRGGPTAFFKLSNVVTTGRIPNHGRATSHIPELNLHGFGTRLGHRLGRFLGSLFPHNAELRGRQVVTFHNQRDFLFVRHHRYIFDPKKDGTKPTPEEQKETPISKVKTGLQELGPRFTLKMRWLQEGTFDTHFGEYEWIHKRKEMDVSRRKFHL